MTDENLIEGPWPDPGKFIHFLNEHRNATEEVAKPAHIAWDDFWVKDHNAADWALDQIFAHGRGHSIYADAKAGKSLFTLWASLQLIQNGYTVVYFDYEMNSADLYERLQDMGCSASTDLSELRYFLLPSLPPLNTREGAKQFIGLIDEATQSRPVAVFIDTISRALDGDENSSDAIKDFYNLCGLPLKQRGATWARLDHSGKDRTKGARGTSAKRDDIDISWQLVAVDGGIELRRDATRIGWVPEKVTLAIKRNPLSYEVIIDSWPAGTVDMAKRLDDLAIPLDWGRPRVIKALKDASPDGRAGDTNAIGAAIRWRKRYGANGHA